MFFTHVSQVANMLLISNKISINKNKQIYFFLFFSLFFSIDIFHFPTAVGTEGHLLLAKVQFFYIEIIYLQCKYLSIFPLNAIQFSE